MPDYYTKQGKKIRNPSAYAKTGSPMYKGGKISMSRHLFINL